jgi:hypothetical protein
VALEYSIYFDGKIEDDFIKGEFEKLSTINMGDNERFPLDAYSFGISTYIEEYFQENFGFLPVAGYTFRLDKFASPDYSSTMLIKASLAVAQNEKVSNSVLLFNGDIPIFHYTSETLFLNESRGYWTPEKLDLIQIPYKFKHIPVL